MTLLVVVDYFWSQCSGIAARVIANARRHVGQEFWSFSSAIEPRNVSGMKFQAGVSSYDVGGRFDSYFLWIRQFWWGRRSG
jgi:hypothetical protein